MASPRRPGIQLETDRVSGAGAVILAAVFLLVTAAGTYWAYAIVAGRVERQTLSTARPTPPRAQETPDPTHVGRMQLTQIRHDSSAAALESAQRRSLTEAGWLDEQAGTARIDIEHAMAAVAAGLGGDTVSAARPAAPAPPAPDRDSVRADTSRGAPDTTRNGLDTARTIPDASRHAPDTSSDARDTSRSARDPSRMPLEAGLFTIRAGRQVGGPLAEARVIERPGVSVPLDAELIDAEGRSVRLGRYFDGTTPVLLVPGYYHCAMLCGLVLDGIADAVAASALMIGRDYRVVAFSIDPRDTPASARDRRSRINARVPPQAWPFLIGSPETVRRLADAIGFGYAYDADSEQYAHAAVVVVLTPYGRISRYLYGVDFTGANLDRAVGAAAAGETGSALTRALLRCFHYTPALRRWAGLIASTLRGGGLLIILALASVIALAARRARQRRALSPAHRHTTRRRTRRPEAGGP